MPMYGNAGAWIFLPFAVISIMSPRSMPSSVAVSGWISTHELQQIFETGSGSSWSHGLFAPRPSPSTGDGYVTKKYLPWVLPIGFARRADAGAGAAAMVRAATVPDAIPLGSAAANAVGPPGKRLINHAR